jgi:hypothetical protein
MIPRHLITTWICDPERDRFTESHRNLFAKCLTSWLRLMPDYALTIITLGNVFDHGREPWVEACVTEGNFIVASVWARLHWLNVLGGVYFDMDVEAARRFDSLLGEQCVIGHIGAGKPYANNAVIAAEAGHPFLQEQLDALPGCDPASRTFGNDSGPYLISELLQRRGWDGRDEDVRVGEVRIVSSRVLHPYSWLEPFTPACIGPETIAIHHWAQSWQRRKRGGRKT